MTCLLPHTAHNFFNKSLSLYHSYEQIIYTTYKGLNFSIRVFKISIMYEASTVKQGSHESFQSSTSKIPTTKTLKSNLSI